MLPARVMSKKPCRIFKDANRNIQQMFLSHLKSSSLSLDILCLQEVSAFHTSPHLTSEQCHRFNTYMFPNCSTIFTKHCAIVCLNPSYHLDNDIVSPNERCISASVIHNQTNSVACTIIDVYGPAQDSEKNSFLDYFITSPFVDLLLEDTTTILLGDLNLNLASLSNSTQNPSFLNWYEWITGNFINSFPDGHPTFRRGSHYTTIDYIFYTPAASSRISNCGQSYLPSTYTDHQMLHIDLFQDRDDIGPGVWRFNPTLLDNDDFVLLLDDMVRSFLEQSLDTPHPLTSSGSKWEAFKAALKATSEYFSRCLKKRRKNIVTSLQQEYQQATTQIELDNPSNHQLRQRAADIAKKLDDEMQQKTKEILLRSATRWHEKGERSNKYFYKVKRGRQHKQTMQALRSVTTGELLSSTTDILKETHRFYTDLYQPT